MRSILVGFLIISVIAVSCTKDPTEVPDPQQQNVTKISSAPNDFQAFEYNTQGFITRYTNQWSDGTGGLNKTTHSMEYNGNEIVKATNDVGYIIYQYRNELPFKSESFFFTGRKLSTFLYHYNQQGKLEYVIEQIAQPQPDGPVETRVSYQYNVNQNVNRIDFASRHSTAQSFAIIYSAVFAAYDNKKNPVSENVLGNFLPGIKLQINNPVKIDNLDGNGHLTGYSRFEYTYNGSGYPVQKKQFIAVGSVEQSPITFEYIY